MTEVDQLKLRILDLERVLVAIFDAGVMEEFAFDMAAYIDKHGDPLSHTLSRGELVRLGYCNE